MATYCYRCPACGYRVETTVRDPAPTCRRHSLHFASAPEETMVRDYRAESVNIGPGVLVSKRSLATLGT